MVDYTLKSFVDDLHAITSTQTDPAAITAKAAPLLARLCGNPEAIPVEYRTAPAGQRGRYMLHRAPRFNVTAVIWRPGDEAGSHDHETWGLVGVVENEIQETRYTSSGARELGGKTALQVREGCATSGGPCPYSFRLTTRSTPCTTRPRGTRWRFTCTARIWPASSVMSSTRTATSSRWSARNT